MHRIFSTGVASVYPLYLAKVEKKGRTREELHRVMEWLTGFDDAALHGHLAAGTTFSEFFAAAELNPGASSITGTICGVRIEDVDDPLMKEIRCLDELVDELARAGRWTRSSAASAASADAPPVRATARYARCRTRPSGGGGAPVPGFRTAVSPSQEPEPAVQVLERAHACVRCCPRPDPVSGEQDHLAAGVPFGQERGRLGSLVQRVGLGHDDLELLVVDQGGQAQARGVAGLAARVGARAASEPGDSVIESAEGSDSGARLGL